VDAGRLDIASVASAGEITVTPQGLDVASFTALGAISFDGTVLNAFGEEASDVYIRGGQFVMSNASALIASTSQSDRPRVIDVDGLSLSASGILASGSASGVGPSMRIDADTLRVADSSAITTLNDGAVNGGSIDIRAGTLTVRGDGTPAGLSFVGTGSTGGTG